MDGGDEKPSRAGGKPAKARRRKALKLKGRNAPRAAPRRSSSRIGQIEVARLARELNEAREQQTATSEVLQVISRSPGDLEPVFSTVLEKAIRICEAKFGMLYRHENGKLCLMAARDVPPMFAAAQAGPFTPAPGGMLDSLMKTGRTVHLADLATTQAYLERHPIMVEAVELGGIRTVVGIIVATFSARRDGAIELHRVSQHDEDQGAERRGDNADGNQPEIAIETRPPDA
jgi:two-component system NtrC family sensor kinase